MKRLLLPAILLTSLSCLAQRVGVDWFVRIPHVFNANLSQKTSAYASVVSTGFTFSYQQLFADFGIYIDHRKTQGYYSYFGSSISQKALDDRWTLLLNAFGEITLTPVQAEQARTWTYTAGLSPVAVHRLSWGTLAIAITCGPAYSHKAVSVNSRLIINCSLPLRR